MLTLYLSAQDGAVIFIYSKAAALKNISAAAFVMFLFGLGQIITHT